MKFLEVTGGVFWIVAVYAVGATIHDRQMSGTWWWKREAR